MKKPLKCVLSVYTNSETAVALVLLFLALCAFAQSPSLAQRPPPIRPHPRTARQIRRERRSLARLPQNPPLRSRTLRAPRPARSSAGSLQGSNSLYRKALALKPGMPGLRLNLGLALFKAGDLKAAIPEFTMLLKSAPPNSPEAMRYTILLGMAHYGLGQFTEAAPYLEDRGGRRSAEPTHSPRPRAQLSLVKAVQPRPRRLPRDPHPQSRLR